MKLRAVLGLLRRCLPLAVSGSYQVKPTFAPPTPPVKPGTGGTVPGVTQVSPRGRVHLTGNILLIVALFFRVGGCFCFLSW